MRVGEVTRGIDLMRLHSVEQISCYLNVFRANRLLSHSAGLVKGQVEEVDAVGLNTRVAGSRSSFGAADEPLHLLEFWNVNLASRLVTKEGPNFFGNLAGLGADTEGSTEGLNKVYMGVSCLVPHGNVTARLIGDMDFVALLTEADEGASHADHVVVRMGAEDNDPLGETAGIGVGGNTADLSPLSWLTSWPASDGVLQASKDIDVDVVGPVAV